MAAASAQERSRESCEQGAGRQRRRQRIDAAAARDERIARACERSEEHTSNYRKYFPNPTQMRLFDE